MASNEFYLKGYYLLQRMIVRLDQINKYAQSLRDTVTPEESYRVICRLNVLLRDLADNEVHDGTPNDETHDEIELEQELDQELEQELETEPEIQTEN